MNLKIIQTGICAVILIALLLSAGCAFLPGGNTAAPTGSATPSVTTRIPTVTVTAAASAVPTSQAAASGTTDPWANFVAPTTAPGQVITGAPTAAGTEAITPVVTATPFVEVTLTEPPTPVPTTPSVADTCSNIGGNVCMANETCSGAFIKTTDQAQCCAGVCQSK